MRVKAGMLVLYCFMFVVIILYILPLYWMISSSFKTTAEITRIPPTWWPHLFSVGGYTKVWRSIFLRYLLNTLIYAGGSTVVGLFTS
ncbi:carbohydrate ABC transporter permease, partial [bacterium]|nr:carbohydrate ABC transporter permease [bacterium]